MRAGSNLTDVIKRTASDSNLDFEYVGMNKNTDALEEEGPRDCKTLELLYLVEQNQFSRAMKRTIRYVV